MIVFGTCVGPDPSNYEQFSLPSIERIADRSDVVVRVSGDGGICRAYNEVLDRARAQPSCQAVVLLHDDVEIIDPRFREKVLAAMADDSVGIVGVAGGSGLRSLAWWHARRRYGAVFESRGFLDIGPRYAEVDAVDGLLMVLSPQLVNSLRFDEQNLPRFHGYDVDASFQSRAMGLKVRVIPLDVLHRTKGGYGDRESFAEAERAVVKKWPAEIRRGPLPVRLSAAGISSRRWLRNQSRAWMRERFLRLRGPAPEYRPNPREGPALCPVCDIDVQVDGDRVPTIAVCPSCGVGITWPLPGRNVEGDGIFKDLYGGTRLLNRFAWNREAQLRVSWVQLYLTDGVLLELGSATGEFVRAATAAGFDAYGSEVSEWAAQHARRSGVDVVSGYLQDWISARPGVRPDAIAMWHVLEHIPEPRRALGEMAHLLGQHGLLFLEIPNFDSDDAKALGMSWDQVQPKDHFHHFGRRSLQRLLEQAGFEVLEVLPITRRVYASPRRWKDRRTEAYLNGRPWPPYDYLRAVARVRSDATRSVNDGFHVSD